jgi:16S rRNA processing protein RimM
MNKQDCYLLGYIAKLHGFKGEVSLFLDVSFPDEYQKLDVIFIEINDNLTPFFIQSYKLQTKGFATIKFEGINDENEAKKILRKSVFLPVSTLPELTEKNFYDHEVVGFELIDDTFGLVGKIIQIIDLPVNPLIQVDANGKEVLIPFVNDLIQNVDRENRKLHVKTPEGLLAIYL